ncbi:MAG: hypothetical protein IKW96_12930 [Ruminococcus sp.]|uniref:vWA domain-containing protein n=1 Tax=Ruminococcus sp. TaxID=41978 RepID=UPI0025F2FF72|nr:hypothetical protein [Ruminococcus sp.]MBR5684155.1 hypothetical protein [Ruminococcus sp.]
MAKKKEDKISKCEQQLLDGIELIDKHPLFGKLRISTINVPKSKLGRNVPAKVSSSGYVYLNKDCDKTPKEWAYIIAHCMLHLSFGHFDADRMPGYWQKISEKKEKWVNDYVPALWNMACDIFITRFLADVKFGSSNIDMTLLNTYGSASSELKIYDQLVERHISADSNVFGTAGEFPDMIGTDSPLTYRYGKNHHITDFAYALADSVRSVINEAADRPASDGRHRSVMAKAAEWFINHYPLLGGVATGFKLVETHQRNDLDDIEIAAVNVVNGEIYVNPAAGLTLEEWKFVLAHEYLHAGLQHHARRNGREPYLWNIACDFVINGWLNEMQIGIMPQNGLMYDETLKNQSAEEIYDRLIEDLRKNSKLSTFRGYGKGDIIDKGWSPDKGGATSLDDFCKSALRSGLEYHTSTSRGYIPAGLIEEIKALSMPPVPWDVELAKWFDTWFAPLEKHRTYARPSRRQSSTPDIPRPSWVQADIPEYSRTYAVIIDTSGSMSPTLIGKALGAAASYSVAKDVPLVRVVFCDAHAYDIGYVDPEDIAGRVAVKGRGGTVLQPAVDLLERAKDFPKDGPILIITDAGIEHDLKVHHEHAFLIPNGSRLPFRAKGKVFYFK